MKSVDVIDTAVHVVLSRLTGIKTTKSKNFLNRCEKVSSSYQSITELRLKMTEIGYHEHNVRLNV